MPKEFFSGWTVESPAIRPVTLPVSSQYCRDIAYHAMTRVLHDRFQGSARSHTDSEDRIFALGWRRWVERNASTLIFTAQIVQSARNIDWFRDHAIPLMITKLQNKFPTVMFTPYTHTEPFSGAVIYGVELHGSIDVISAFYWTCYIMRCAEAEGPGGFVSPSGKYYDWKSVNTLLLRAAKGNERDAHYIAWNALREGSAPTSVDMLIHLGGPLTAAYRNSIGMRAEELARIEQITSDVAHPYHRWFHE